MGNNADFVCSLKNCKNDVFKDLGDMTDILSNRELEIQILQDSNAMHAHVGQEYSRVKGY